MRESSGGRSDFGIVIPANAGIQCALIFLDPPGFRLALRLAGMTTIELIRYLAFQHVCVIPAEAGIQSGVVVNRPLDPADASLGRNDHDLLNARTEILGHLPQRLTAMADCQLVGRR